MKIFITIITSSLLLFGCKIDYNQTEKNMAYLGGEIINPNTNFIVLSKSKSVIDTIKLDGRNRFMYKLNKLETGIYTFKHGGESQMVLLEPNDSILFRLNTLDFDESLVFTGFGARKNNFLINDFLENEKIEKKVYKYCQLTLDKYEAKIDSLNHVKTKKLNAFKNKYSTSDLFNKIAESNNQYNHYFFKEIYPLFQRHDSKYDILKQLPKDFYSYRGHINYNDTLLKESHTYKSFLRSTCNNLALQKHFNHSDNQTFKRSSLCYNMDKLNIIDSLVKNTLLKNTLLRKQTIHFLARNKDFKHNISMLNLYLSKSNNENDKKLVTTFYNAITKLKKGATLPNIELIDYENAEHNINNIIKTSTIVTFWSHDYYKHFKESHYKLKQLKEKYPSVNFVVINLDNYGADKSKKTLKNNRFPRKNEYYFKHPEKAIETLAIHPITKTIIVDENKNIVNTYTSIFSKNFEQQVVGLLNR